MHVFLEMFHSSTQKEHWLYETGDELERLRVATNRAYCEKVASII